MKKLDRFILRDILSDGPAGTVYKAEEILPGDNRRTVALKVLPPLPGGAVTGETPEEKRFFGEVRMLAQLAVHPNVVTIYGMGISEDYPWLAMEYTPTTLLHKLADAPGDPAEIRRMLREVGRGLVAMHGLKPALIHQDLKPANILVDPLGNHKITDFSLATVTAANKTHNLATVRYAAPELLSSEYGRVGPATDLYALGHIAYEMALGQKLHRQQFPAVFEGNTTKEPAPNKWMMWHASIGSRPADVSSVVRGFPDTLGEVIAKLMAKPLASRYASAEELLSDMEMLGTAEAVPAPAPRATPGPAVPAPAPAAPVAAAAPVPAPPAASAPANAAPLPRYWVRLRGKVSGPYDLPTLQRLVKQGQISRLHQLSTDQAVWKPAAELEGLYGPTVV